MYTNGDFLCTLYTKATLSTTEIYVHIYGTIRGPKLNGEELLHNFVYL